MHRRIPHEILQSYGPVSSVESLYLRTRWRLCPFETIESLVPRNGRILDFGCGYGILANLIALRAPTRQIDGVDVSQKRISVAKRSAFGRPNIAFHRGDAKELRMEAYDAVVMTDVMHHLNDLEARCILKKIRSCLKSEGILLILDVDRSPFWKFLITYFIDKCLNMRNSLHYRSSAKLVNLLRQNAYMVKEIIPAHQGLPLSDIIYVCKVDLNRR